MFLSRPAPMRALLSASRSLPLTTSSTASILVAGGAPARFSSTTATVASNTHTGTNHASASVPLSATAAAAAAAVAAASAPRQKLRYSGVASHRAVSSPHRDYLERTIRVDHAGELGALRIYQGQLAVLTRLPNWWAPNAPSRTSPGGETPQEAIQHMLEQEREHLTAFEHLLAARQVRPTVLTPIWSVAGYAAGAATALAGEKMAMALTAAVEDVIAGHYNDQIREVHDLELRDTEAALRKMLVQFRDDEEEHKSTAIIHNALEAPFYDAFSQVVKVGCKVAIELAERI